MARDHLKRKSVERAAKEQAIVIDEAKGLIFDNEEHLYQHFKSEIHQLEQEFFSRHREEDLQVDEFPQYEELLSSVLEDPDEIWESADSIGSQTVYSYLGHFEFAGRQLYYVALTYVTDETPSFVYLHFPTTDGDLVEHYRNGQLIYDRMVEDVQKGAIEGDASSEGDELAVGLYKSMLTVRGEKDIPEEEFQDFIEHREISIEEADEIWRAMDFNGITLVSFIKEISDSDDLFYIVVTVEDEPSSSHALLFSFPTRDRSLVDRYRHGENLQAEEIVQEASH